MAHVKQSSLINIQLKLFFFQCISLTLQFNKKNWLKVYNFKSDYQANLMNIQFLIIFPSVCNTSLLFCLKAHSMF